MFDISGLHDRIDAHVQEAIYRSLDARTIKLSWMWMDDGVAASEEYTLSRLL